MAKWRWRVRNLFWCLVLGLCFTVRVEATLPWPERVGDYCNVTDNGVIELEQNDLMTVRRATIAWVEQHDKVLRVAERRFSRIDGVELPEKALRRELREIAELIQDFYDFFDGVSLSPRSSRSRTRYERIRDAVDTARRIHARIIMLEVELDELKERD